MHDPHLHLVESHKKNWQNYLDSISGRTVLPVWDTCIITASNEDQARAYRLQLRQRIKSNFLPAETDFMVLPDPNGKRVGSGGATLNALLEVYLRFQRNQGNQYDENQLAGKRVLIIHSGGDSKRIPQYSVFGKLFSRIPRQLPDGRPSTLFDEFFISLSTIPAFMNEGVLVVSGDILLLFDSSQLDFGRQGVIGVSCKVPVSMGTNHGVYVENPQTGRVHRFLHKASKLKLSTNKAVDEAGYVNLDTGIVWMDVDVAKNLVDLIYDRDLALMRAKKSRFINDAIRLNFYGDFLFPLTADATLEDYIKEPAEGICSAQIREVRTELWNKLHGIPFYVQSLSPAEFIHFGTSREFLNLLTSNIEYYSKLGWTKRTLGYSAKPSQKETLMNACIEGKVISNGNYLVEDSHLCCEVAIGEHSVISNVISSLPLEVKDGIIVHQLPINDELGILNYVTRIYGVEDNPKSPLASGTYCNMDWKEWLSNIPGVEKYIWEESAFEERTLWNARLFPVCRDRDESLYLSLWLQSPTTVSGCILDKWISARRISLQDCISLADRSQILQDQIGIENLVRRKIFLQLIDEERDFEEFKGILGTEPTSVVSNVSLIIDDINRSADQLYRMRGYRVVAELLRNMECKPSTDAKVVVAAGKSGTTGKLYTWSVFEDKAFAELSSLIQTNPVFSIDNREHEFRYRRVRVRAACRADLAGGWSDTPPFSLEKGGIVLNCALELNGELPVLVAVEILDEPKLVLASEDLHVRKEVAHTSHIFDCRDPSDPLAIHKAALVITGVIPYDLTSTIADLFGKKGKGLSLTTRVDVPKGSGLGTSSILAGAVIASLHCLMGRTVSEQEIFNQVLILEQMLTTGGGWQDQVGGLTGGIKLVSSSPGVPQIITYEPVALSSIVRKRFDEQFVIVFTGQRRLAKRILRDIMGAYMLRKNDAVRSICELKQIALSMKEALVDGDLALVGRLMNRHWELNKTIDPRCTNPLIDSIFRVCEPYVHGGKLCGAGGGGFMELILKDGVISEQLNKVLGRAYPDSQVRVWPARIVERALEIEKT